MFFAYGESYLLEDVCDFLSYEIRADFKGDVLGDLPHFLFVSQLALQLETGRRFSDEAALLEDRHLDRVGRNWRGRFPGGGAGLHKGSDVRFFVGDYFFDVPR